MTVLDPACSECRNYLGRGKCLAFPDAIPEEIMDALNDHREPFKGDNGIRFEPIEGKREKKS